jgi:2-polyprenyl-3-methyl-5-hydroxy-6-metoxy-1,4-benzoquinol methylase
VSKTNVFIDLGKMPLSNAFIPQEKLDLEEKSYPLRVAFNEENYLVRLDHLVPPENIFNEDYAYFSSCSQFWLDHSKKFCEMITKRLFLSKDSLVLEVASNDGYLLKNFVNCNIPCVGMEPSESVANVAIEHGIDTIIDFFGQQSARSFISERSHADLIVANNVLAHVPNIHDFLAGLKIALSKTGTITIEFPHLYNLLKYNQFDTIYHEHYSYLSMIALENLLQEFSLFVYDVEEFATHGGSLRIYATHQNRLGVDLERSEEVLKLRNKEIEFGLNKLNTYEDFSERVANIRITSKNCIQKLKDDNKKIFAYGAAAKGTIFLNYCNIGSDMIDFIVDINPHKQDKLMPGVKIPIIAPELIQEHKPDYILILPWNIKEEIMNQLEGIREWGGRFIIAIPEFKIF